jgi:hypothetical protein
LEARKFHAAVIEQLRFFYEAETFTTDVKPGINARR